MLFNHNLRPRLTAFSNGCRVIGDTMNITKAKYYLNEDGDANQGIDVTYRWTKKCLYH